MLFLPLPHVLALLFGFSLTWLVCLAATRRSVIGWTTKHFLPRLPAEWAVIISRTILLCSVLLAMFASFVFPGGMGRLVENRLWATGNFGEPPGNRYIAACGNGNSSTLLIEFGVRTFPIMAPSIGVDAGPSYKGSTRQEFFAPSGAIHRGGVCPPVTGGYSTGARTGGEDATGFHITVMTKSVTKDVSLYVLLTSSTGGLAVYGCYFRGAGESTGKDCNLPVRAGIRQSDSSGMIFDGTYQLEFDGKGLP